MKKIMLVTLACVMALSLMACAAPAEPTAVRVAALKGPTGMGMAKLMADNDAGQTLNDYAFSLVSSPDEIVSLITTGQVDIAAAPTNLAALLFNRTEGDVQMLALNTLGVLYVLERGDTVHTVADLAGRTLIASGQGSTAEYILDYILSAHGLKPGDDVTVAYKSEHAEAATLATAGEADLVLLPEPFVTSVIAQDAGFRVALDLTDEWLGAAALNGVSGSAMAMGCLIVNREFAERHPDAVEAFLAEYSASTYYVNQNNEDAAALIARYGILPSAAVAQAALPNCNIVYVDGAAMKQQVLPFLQVLFDAQPASVGGVMPDDGFFYAR